MATAVIDRYIYIFGATSDESQNLQVAIFLIENFEKGKIKFLTKTHYRAPDFIDPFTKKNLKGEFNLRDVLYYQSQQNTIFKDFGLQSVHNLICS